MRAHFFSAPNSIKMTSSYNSENFFLRGHVDQEYWNNYIAARPVYDQSFYDSIWAYHISHNGRFSRAIDVGTGPGQVAGELSKLFGKTIASDNNETHLAVAAHRLFTQIDPQKVQLAQCSAENIATLTEPNSTDMITAAECLPLMDTHKAMQGFATVLKPGGSLVIWFYGRPVFAEQRYFETCQPLLNAIVNNLFAKIIKGGSPQHRAGWKRATDQMASFLDDIEFDQSIWTDVQRKKWNSRFPLPFYDPEACDFDVQPTSAISAKEKITEEEDLSCWEKQWNIEDVKRFVLANLPTFNEKMQDTEEIRRLYKRLGHAMGGPNAIRKITWPVVAIMATKR